MLEVAQCKCRQSCTRGLQIVGIYVEFSPSSSSSTGSSAYLKEREIVLRGAQSLVQDHLPKASSSSTSPFLFVEFQNSLFSSFFSAAAAEQGGRQDALSLVRCYTLANASSLESGQGTFVWSWDGTCATRSVEAYSVTGPLGADGPVCP